MIRILITPSIIELAEDYAQNLFKNRRKNFKRPLPSLKKFEVQLRKAGAEKHANYVKMIIQKYSIINTIQPQDFEKFHEDFLLHYRMKI